MSLRSRLLLGYGVLTAVLLASVGGAALVFHTLGRGIDRVLEENVASVHVATQLGEILERQNAHLLHALSNSTIPLPPPGREEFLDLLGAARTNVTVAGEREIIDAIEATYREFAEANARLLAAPATHDLFARYDREVGPSLAACRARLQALLDLNIEAIHSADRGARKLAARASAVLSTLAAAGVLLLAFASNHIERHLLKPLADMQRAAETVVGGESRHRLPRGADDELGRLATLVNIALEQRDSAVEHGRGVLAHQRQLLLALLASLPEPAALVGLDGAVVASTLAEEDTLALEASQQALRDARRVPPGDTPAAGPPLYLPNGTSLQLQLLLAPPQRPVGWLARRA